MALRYGPLELGGLDLYDLRTEAGIESLKFLRNSLSIVTLRLAI